MNTKTKLIAWDGQTYQGAGDTYDWLAGQEACADLDPDQLLRLAIFAYNGGWALVEEDLPTLIAHEEEAYYGEAESEAQFAEEYFESSGLIDGEATKHLVIDWAATYNYSLQYDFFTYEVIDLDGRYVKLFWNANI